MKSLLRAILVCLVASTIKAAEPPSGGAPLFSGDPVSVFNYYGPATKSIVSVSGMPFARAIRMECLEEATNSWDIALYSATTAPVTAGDVGLLHFYMRAVSSPLETGEVIARAYVQRGESPWDKSTNRTSFAGSEWVEVFTPFEFNDTYSAGAQTVNFALGFGVQTLEIGGIEVLNYGDLYTVEELPRSSASYFGRAPDAAWRAPAATRIEQYRKSDFTIKVVDANGRPVVLPQVEIRQERHAFEFGTAAVPHVIMDVSGDGTIYRQKLLENFNALGPENALKMPAWQGNWGAPNFSQATTLAGLQWMQQNGFAIRGHVMVWPSYSHLASSIKAEIDAGNTGSGSPIPGLLLGHIDDITQATAAYVNEWDVVNEPYSNHELMDYFGDGIMVDWFHQARQNLPTAGLFLNDYGILSGGGTGHDHQDHFEQTAQYLIAQGAPITGLGLQSHFGENLTAPGVVYDLLERYAALGLDLRITEFDIDTPDESLQADYLRDFLTVVFSHPAATGFQMWGFWEGKHWKPDAALYRLDWSEKPVLTAYQDLVLDQWWTDLQGWGDGEGTFTGRAFKGTLTATTTLGGETKDVTFTLGDSVAEVIVRVDTYVEPVPLSVSNGTGGMARVSFGTRTGLDYQIEESTDLHSWSPFGPVHAGDGNPVSLDVPAPHREWFFRLAISPVAH